MEASPGNYPNTDTRLPGVGPSSLRSAPSLSLPIAVFEYPRLYFFSSQRVISIFCVLPISLVLSNTLCPPLQCLLSSSVLPCQQLSSPLLLSQLLLRRQTPSFPSSEAENSFFASMSMPVRFLAERMTEMRVGLVSRWKGLERD